jgi:hypothetical protein
MRLLNRGWSIAVLALVSAGSAALAQSIVPHSKDVAGNISFNGHGGIDGKMQASYGLSGSYNVWRNLAAVGEFEYQPFGSNIALRQTVQRGGGGFRYYFMTSPRLAPYVIATGGFARLGTAQVGTGLNVSEKDGYFSAGGGASFFVDESWGIRPEVRYLDEFVGLRYPVKETVGSISLFYQFGGSGIPAKKK